MLLMTVDPTSFSEENDGYLQKLRYLFDYVFKLESFFDSKEFEDFNGFFKILKTPNLNKLSLHQYETNVFGIK